MGVRPGGEWLDVGFVRSDFCTVGWVFIALSEFEGWTKLLFEVRFMQAPLFCVLRSDCALFEIGIF